MYFLLTYDVVSDYMLRRETYRDEHLALALSAVERGELLLGGALTEPAMVRCYCSKVTLVK